MGFLDQLLAGGISGVASGIGSLAKDIRTAITGQTPLDANKQAELLLQMQALEAAAIKAASDYDTLQMQAQTAINQAESQSTSRFVSGWRPAVGWVCVLGLLYTFLAKPLLPWCIAVGGLLVGRMAVVPPLPEVPMGDLLVLLGGMLGIGTMRSVEKIKGVAK